MRNASLGLVAALALIAAVGCSSKGSSEASTRRQVVSELAVRGDGVGSALVVTVPDAKDGQQDINPPGTVEVYSVAPNPVLTADDNTVQNPCNAPALFADVMVRSYATEQLSNVMVEFTDVNPVSHAICNAAPETVPPEVSSAIGVIGYGDLAASAVSDGSAPGGSSTVQWWISDQPTGPFAFNARVWADVTPAPPSNPSPAPGSSVGTSVTLTWTGSTLDGAVQVATDPLFASVVESMQLTGTDDGNGGFTFSYPVVSANSIDATYYWRAVNRFQQPSGGALVEGTFATGGSYTVLGAPQIGAPFDGEAFQDGQPVPLGAWVSASAEGASFSVCPDPDCVTVIEGGPGTELGLGYYEYQTSVLAPGVYYWQVQNVVGGEGVGTAAASYFYVDTPPTLVSPPDQAQLYTPDALTPSLWLDFDAVSMVAPYVNVYVCDGDPLCEFNAWYWDSIDMAYPAPISWEGYEGTHGWFACTDYGDPLGNGWPDYEGLCSPVATFTINLGP